jgi:hypothetical protein
MSRSSRRSHSPVTPPSGEATAKCQTSVRHSVANDTRHERSGQLRPRVELARHYAREAGAQTLGSRSQCRMRSTPIRFVGVLAPRTTPTIRPGKGNADSPLRSYSVVASKGTGGRTRRCLQPHVHPVGRKASRPSPNQTGPNGEEEGLTHTVLRSAGAFEVQTNHTRGAALTCEGERGPACRLRLRRREDLREAGGSLRRLSQGQSD